MHRHPLRLLVITSGFLSVALLTAVPAPWARPDGTRTTAPVRAAEASVAARDPAPEVPGWTVREDAEPARSTVDEDPFVAGPALRRAAIRTPGDVLPEVRRGLLSGDERMRFFALEAALRAADRSLVDVLRPMTFSDDHRVRRLAFGALVRAGEPDAAGELLRFLGDAQRDGDLWGEVLAAEYLATAEHPGGADRWLRGLLAMDPVDRAMAVSRFREGAPASLEPTLRKLLGDPIPDVRAAAAVALGLDTKSGSRRPN